MVDPDAAAEMVARIRRNLNNNNSNNDNNNGLETREFGKIPVISFSEEQYLLDNDPSNQALYTQQHHHRNSTSEGLPVDQSGLYCHVSRECSICLSQYENLDSVAVLPCFHFYHEQCITEWLVRNDVCPLCKQRVSVMLSKPNEQDDGMRTPPMQMNSPWNDRFNGTGRSSGTPSSDWQPRNTNRDSVDSSSDTSESAAAFGIQRLTSVDPSHHHSHDDSVDIESGLVVETSHSPAVDHSSVFSIGFGIGRDGRFTYVNIFEEKDAEDDHDDNNNDDNT